MFMQMRAAFMAAGADATTATERAYAGLAGMVARQAAIVSFVGLFQLLGVLFIVLIPLVLLMKRLRSGAVRSTAVACRFPPASAMVAESVPA